MSCFPYSDVNWLKAPLCRLFLTSRILVFSVSSGILLCFKGTIFGLLFAWSAPFFFSFPLLANFSICYWCLERSSFSLFFLSSRALSLLLLSAYCFSLWLSSSFSLRCLIFYLLDSIYYFLFYSFLRCSSCFSACFLFSSSSFFIFSYFSLSKFYFICSKYFYRFAALALSSSTEDTEAILVFFIDLWDWLLFSCLSLGFLLSIVGDAPGTSLGYNFLLV